MSALVIEFTNRGHESPAGLTSVISRSGLTAGHPLGLRASALVQPPPAKIHSRLVELGYPALGKREESL